MEYKLVPNKITCLVLKLNPLIMKDLGTTGHTNSLLKPTFVQSEVWDGLKLPVAL